MKKMFGFLTSLFLMAFFVGSAFGQYQQFGLTQDLVKDLGMTQEQVEAAKKQLLLLNYDFNNAIVTVAQIDEQIEETEASADLSPQAVGQKVGFLTERKVTLIRQIIAEITATNKSLLALLTPSQQQRLNSFVASVESAIKVLNTAANAQYANFALRTYGMNDFERNGYTAVPTMSANSLANAVAQVRAQRQQERLAAAQKARLVE